jgi:hypothetical protein
MRKIQITLLRLILILLSGEALLPRISADTAPEAPLHQLLERQFGKLSIAEERLASAAANGKTADCTDLSGDQKNVKADLLVWLCTDVQATGQLTFRGISITGAEIVGQIDLKWAKIAFPITASKSVFRYDVDLANSDIAFLSLADSRVRRLDATEAHIAGSLNLERSIITDGVELRSAKIGGYLDCEGAQLTGNPALDANSATIEGSVFLRDDFKADGGVTLIATKVGVNLVCDGGTFIRNKNVPAAGGMAIPDQFMSGGSALDANSAKVEGDVRLRGGFKAEGDVIFTFGYAGGSFQWSGVKSPEEATLDLTLAQVRTVLNDQASLPRQVSLDGFTYDQIDPRSSLHADDQLRWLALPPDRRFSTQPFEQLASVFRRMGLEEDARAVIIAKNENVAQYFRGHPGWLWYGVFGKLIGYGYKPWRAFFVSVVIIGVGSLIFSFGHRRRLITPTSEAAYGTEGGTPQLLESYPRFNSLVYSLETFVPLVKMGVGDHWMPNANRGRWVGVEAVGFTTGGLLRLYYWFHITAGWVFSALWVGALTGLVKT